LVLLSVYTALTAAAQPHHSHNVDTNIMSRMATGTERVGVERLRACRFQGAYRHGVRA
jgi:hypothetical protein